MCRDTRLATDPARFQALMRLGRELTAGSCWRARTVRGTSGDWPNSWGAKALEGMDPSAHWGRKFPIQGTSGPIFEGSWDQLPVTQQGTSLSTSTWAVEGTGRRSSGQAAEVVKKYYNLKVTTRTIGGSEHESSPRQQENQR